MSPVRPIPDRQVPPVGARSSESAVRTPPPCDDPIMVRTLGHPATRAMRRARVAVWQVALDLDDGSLAGAAAVLSPDELRRADRGEPDERRRRIALRAAVRHVLRSEEHTSELQSRQYL